MKALAALLVSAMIACAAFAADEAGTVKTAKGSVAIERGEQKLPVAVGSKVLAADRVVTGADSSVGITLRDNTLLSAGPNSVLSLDRFSFDATTHAGAVDATLKRGTLAVISGKIAKADANSARFRTPTATLGVRGTEFVIEVAGPGK
jgi:hypothetical protein